MGRYCSFLRHLEGTSDPQELQASGAGRGGDQIAPPPPRGEDHLPMRPYVVQGELVILGGAFDVEGNVNPAGRNLNLHWHQSHP